MNWREWKSLWRFDRQVDIPHLSIAVMTPYAFVRALWYSTSKEFKAWPNAWETGVVLGWRWPWRNEFREKHWIRRDLMPLAVYGGPMDEIYLARATKELLLVDDNFPIERVTFTAADSPIRHIGPTVNALLRLGPRCSHNLWIADCPNCARKALRMAIQLKAKYEPVKLIDPHENPIIGFRRREAEAQAKLAASSVALPAQTEDAQ